MSSNEQSGAAEGRLISLDAYRGLIMIALAFNGFGLAETAKKFLESTPDSKGWERVRFQFSHVDWVGCAFWDLIQPSFMFMVGVSMAFSYLKRSERGDSWGRMFLHATWRSVVLCLLGVFLISNGRPATDWSFMNVLTQIGLGYPFLFLLWRRPWFIQLLVAGALLGSTWALYEYAPTRESPDLVAVGVKETWAEEHLEGVSPKWHKNANIGHEVDLRVLNWFPRAKPFEFNAGGYQTINFIPSLATMILGLICGELLRSYAMSDRKLLGLVVIGIAGVGLGLLWQSQGCPMVKRIWTPSWALYSTGICCLILAGLYAVIDVVGFKIWSFPLVVVGMNSIAIYVMGQLLRPWTAGALSTHFGSDLFTFYGWLEPQWQPVVQSCLVGLCFWLACYYMYRNRIFIKV